MKRATRIILMLVVGITMSTGLMAAAYEVSGAGSSNVNGIYIDQGPYYSFNGYYLYFNSGYWCINSYAGATFDQALYYSVGSITSQWFVATGIPYAPTVNEVEASLPIELASFTASRNGNAIYLRWGTESEIENLGFLIERSANDGHWQEIASYKDDPTLAGQGSVTHTTEYSYSDKNIIDDFKYDYRLADVSYSGDITFHYLDSKVDGTTSALLPSELTVFKNYPNPFNPSTNLSWHLNEADVVVVNIYDVSGQLITELVNRHQSSGYHEKQWDGRDYSGAIVSAGVYLVSVRSGNHTQTRKMLILK